MIGRGPQVLLDGAARLAARGGAGRTMRENIARKQALEASGYVSDGSTVDGTSITGGEPDDYLMGRETDRVSLRYMGAPMDGVNDDTDALNRAIALASSNNQPIFVPHGRVRIAGTIDTTHTFPIPWIMDGVSAATGVPPLTQVRRDNLGDLVENYSQGVKQYFKNSADVGTYGVLRVDYGLDAGVGIAGQVTTPLRVNCQDWTGAVQSMWGIHVAMESLSNQSGWPQNVGGSFTVNKHGSAWCVGVHAGMVDDQNLPSTTGGTALGLEVGQYSNDVDDGANTDTWALTGRRYLAHLGQSFNPIPGGIDSEFTANLFFSGHERSRTKSVMIGSLSLRTYQFLDTRGPTVPTGYASPLAAVRMAADQCIDFNGGAAWDSVGGNYLQYRAATGRLYYVVGGVDKFSIDASGNVRAAGTLTGSTTP